MSTSSDSDWHSNIKHQSTKLGYWTFAWLVTLALSVFGPFFIWDETKSLTIIAIIVNVAMGIGMIFAHKNHLQSQDELRQRIQLEAMGITLGVTLVAGLAYSTLDLTNVIVWDAEIANLVFLMGITYMIAMAIGTWRYR